VEGEVCLDLKLHGDLQRGAAADAAEKEKFPRVLASAKNTFLGRNLAIECSAGLRLRA
jgi:hypothetical protein